jgi:type IV secretion system protein VirB9
MKKQIITLAVLPLFLFSDNYSLSPMEKKSTQMAKNWINNSSKIERQKDGSLGFYYGDNMPTLVCKPLNATIIKLGKDEKIKDYKTGDSDRWKFDVVEDAADGRTFVLVKPMKINIMTNLIIFTDKRIYNIKLISSSTKWTPSISFIYNKLNKNASVFIASPKEEKVVKKTTFVKTQKRYLSEYIINSDGSWKPNNVFTKSGKTYINIGDWNKNRLPRLYIMNGNNSKTIRYTYKNTQLVINGIVKKAILIKDELSKTIIHIRKRK